MSEQQRKLHNQMKRDLISTVSKNANQHLDLACGAGGDIHKWRGINHVLGLDILPESIDRARHRASQLPYPHDYRFEVENNIGIRPLFPSRSDAYDTVSCMFALHFFFRTEQMARRVFKDVFRLLKPGGCFYGIMPNGRAVEKLMGKHGRFRSELYSVERVTATSAPFGTTVKVSMPQFESTEYLVYESVLKRVAEGAGFQVVDTSMVDPSPLDHPVERAVTGQYMCFVFRKPWTDIIHCHMNLAAAAH